FLIIKELFSYSPVLPDTEKMKREENNINRKDQSNRHTLLRSLLSLSLVSALVFPAAVPTKAAEAAKADKPTPLTAETTEAFLDEFFASEQAAPHYTGAAVVIVKDGQIIAQKGYGYANREEERAVDPTQT